MPQNIIIREKYSIDPSITGSIDEAISKAILRTTNVLENEDELNFRIYDILFNVIIAAAKNGSSEIHPPNLARSRNKL